VYADGLTVRCGAVGGADE